MFGDCNCVSLPASFADDAARQRYGVNANAPGFASLQAAPVAGIPDDVVPTVPPDKAGSAWADAFMVVSVLSMLLHLGG